MPTLSARLPHSVRALPLARQQVHGPLFSCDNNNIRYCRPTIPDARIYRSVSPVSASLPSISSSSNPWAQRSASTTSVSPRTWQAVGSPRLFSSPIQKWATSPPSSSPRPPLLLSCHGLAPSFSSSSLRLSPSRTGARLFPCARRLRVSASWWSGKPNGKSRQKLNLKHGWRSVTVASGKGERSKGASGTGRRTRKGQGRIRGERVEGGNGSSIDSGIGSSSSSGTGNGSSREGPEEGTSFAYGRGLGSEVQSGASFAFYHAGLSGLPISAELLASKLPGAYSTNGQPAGAFPPTAEAALSAEEAPATPKSPVARAGALRLLSGACVLPHPDKVHKGGEDAFFISDSYAVGVADGVGGWAEIGIDAGAYARELMDEMRRAVQREAEGGGLEALRTPDPLRVLEQAHSNTSSFGSSTACLVLLAPDQQQLQAANLGDSGFLVIRNGRAIFKSPPQQHDFNFPYQLGTEGGDSPLSADVFSLPVAAGDVVVLGTDGLFDNVFDSELSSMVSQAVHAGLPPQATAEHLAALARDRAQDRFRISPFARAAQEAGYRYVGGKLDDITVVVSYVAEGARGGG